MKSFNAYMAKALVFCFFVFTGLSTTRAQAGEYYIYQDANGKLVISNKEPPPGSKIIKQQNLPDVSENQTAQSEEHNDMETESAPTPSKNK